MNQILALLETATPLAAVGGGAVYARERHPRLYWSTVGLPLTVARIRHDWAETMEACGLSAEPPMWKVFAARQGPGTIKPMPPTLRGVSASTMGLRLRLRLPRGLATEDMANAAEGLRHAWQVHAVHVSEVRPGIIELRITGFDVLRRVVLPSRATSKSAGVMRVPVALGADGRVVVRDYRAAPHGLTLGANQSGKSMYARNLFHGLATQDVALVGIDCKQGVEHAPMGPRLSGLAVDPDSALDLLRVLVNEVMTERFDLIRSYLGIPGRVPGSDITVDIWGLPEKIRPVPLVLVIDEVAELFLASTAAEKARCAETITLLIRFAQMARAAGMYLEVMGQRFGSELGKGATLLRSQLTNRVVHRVNDVESAKMGLGDVSEQGVFAATRIAPDLPGMAIVGDTSGAWQRIRTPYRKLSDTAAVCAATAHLVPDLPALDAFRPVPAVRPAAPEDAPVYVTDPAPA
ncbi:FtsK/SpoIIIE domain-containing protein [Streptacidiphilus cavernicola]|uniref:FtsK/SpoIIIE domain-containing protein n=1 Tax=Streptacidiphilus cavernicola TaxID=3342716 RepID=A0ABV6VRZ2_9ACTN